MIAGVKRLWLDKLSMRPVLFNAAAEARVRAQSDEIVTGGGVRRRLYLCAAMGALAVHGGPAGAAPAVFFSEDLAEGETRFIDVVNAADSGAQIFSYDFGASTPSNFSVTQGATTVYVRSFRAGTPAVYNSNGFQSWSVSYSGGFDTVLDAGYTLEFFADSGFTTPFAVNSVALYTDDWGTCCTTSNVTPAGTADGSAMYMVFDQDQASESINFVGNITTPIPSTTHFVAAIDDTDSFSSLTLAPNGAGEAFGAGGRLLFSLVPIGSVPAGSSFIEVGDVTPDIDAGGPYTTAELNAGDVNPVFTGGVLQLAGAGAVTPDFTVTASNGSIDTNGFDAEFSGAISGAGFLTKTGTGVLTLSGVNTHAGGIVIDAGALAVGDDAALGAGPLEIGAGTFRATGDMSTDNDIVVSAMTSTVDTREHDLTLTGSLSGSGRLSKTGTGVLTLSGTNSHDGGARIEEGVLAAGADAALGAGAVDIGAGAFRALGSFSTDNAFVFSDDASAVDTGAHDLTLTGPLSGSGRLTKTGTGVLTLTGANAHGGVRIEEGVLAAGGDAALGAGAVEIGGGVFRATNSFITDNAFTVSGPSGVIDTQDGVLALAGGLGGAGGLVKRGSGVLQLAGMNALSGDITIMQGALAVTSGGLSARDIIIMEGASLFGAGRIEAGVQVLSGGALSPGASPGVLTVAGDLALSDGALFVVEIDGATPGAGAGNHDQVVLQGADSVFTAGGAVAPVLRGITGDATNTFAPQLGERFTIVEAEGGVADTFDAVLQPTEGLAGNLRFEVVYNPNSIDLIVAPQFYSVTIADGARGNARRVAGHLDAIRTPMGAGPTEAATALFADLTVLSPVALSAALQDLSGEVHASGLSAARRGSRVVRDGLIFDGAGGRVGSGACAAASPADGVAGAVPSACAERDGRQAWIEVFNVKETIDPDGIAAGYDSQHFAVQAGFNAVAVGDARIDLAGGYSRGDFENAGAGDGFVETWTGAVRGATRLGPVTAEAAIGGTYARIESRRSNSLLSAGGNESDSQAYLVHVDAVFSYPTAIGETFVATPFVGVHGEWISADDFTEAGPAATALYVENVDMTTGRTRLGSAFAKRFPVFGKSSDASLRAAWQREINGASLSRDALLHGVSWETRSADAGVNRAELSALWRVNITSTLSAGVEYRGEYNSNVRSHEGVLGLNVLW